MQHVTSARIVRGALTAVLFLSGIADTAGVLAATPTAKSSQSSTLRKVQLSRGAATPAAANPLRSTPPLEFPKPAPTAKASQSADRASTTALRAASAAKKPFVPNTGRLQIFRAAEKPIASTLKNGDVHRLFPKGAGTKVQANAIPMMRYEDVARGEALVPITPRANSRPTTSTKMQTPTTTADSTIAPEVDAPVRRLPPLDRTAPRPRLPAGVKLPQEPIEIYPETDS